MLDYVYMTKEIYKTFNIVYKREYFSDEDHLQQWLESEKEMDQHMAFLSRYVFETSTFSEYLELCGGIPRMQDLRRREWLIE